MSAGVLWAVLAIALASRLMGINWGLPEVYEEAYPLKLAWHMWGLDGRPATLNPGFFHYPSLVVYLQYAVLGLVRAVLFVTGVAPNPDALRALYAHDPTVFVLPITLCSLFLEQRAQQTTS